MAEKGNDHPHTVSPDDTSTGQSWYGPDVGPGWYAAANPELFLKEPAKPIHVSSDWSTCEDSWGNEWIADPERPGKWKLLNSWKERFPDQYARMYPEQAAGGGASPGPPTRP